MQSPYCDKVYFTLVHKEFECDTFFSKDIFDDSKFKLEKPISEYETKEEYGIPFQFLIYRKIKA